jgi:uncharacterized protein (DUF58 family)
VPGAPPTFPLIGRRRGIGLLGGTRRSVHRGAGSETASSRLYRRGDSMRAIDWKASARLSSARDSDEFVVREHFAEDSPRVVVFVDRSPSMALYPPDLPWLHKPAAVAAAGSMIVDSAIAAHGAPGYLDLADPQLPRWLPPRGMRDAARIRDVELVRDAYTAPPTAVTLGLGHLVRARASLPAGSFVFVLSDFLAPLTAGLWQNASALGWELVPVIVQDPRWEQSFPDVSGLALPLAGPDGRGVGLARLSRKEVVERRTANEQRLATLHRTFAGLQLDPVLLCSNDPVAVLTTFLDWATRRRERLRTR